MSSVSLDGKYLIEIIFKIFLNIRCKYNNNYKININNLILDSYMSVHYYFAISQRVRVRVCARACVCIEKKKNLPMFEVS